ncbi:uncharacterized protein [Anoplolepis gracilipes]|uniref:uncharacterized protein isoform X1 n=1 Tax=Anoplolepis gracilipes TaxID=354296 RepID=UPI003BA3331B
MGEGRWTMFSGLGARLIEQANSLVDSMRRDTFDINASRYINHRLSITVECSRNSSLNAYNLSNRIQPSWIHSQNRKSQQAGSDLPSPVLFHKAVLGTQTTTTMTTICT